MNIVSLGRAAGKIAECFRKYETYSIFKIESDSDVKEDKFTKNLKVFKTPEEYESKSGSFKPFLKGVTGDEVLFICVGSSPITGCALRVLENLKHKKITVLYVRPELSLLSDKSQIQEKITFNVFQQYARSALFERIYLVDNPSLEQVLGDIPILHYYDKLNELLSSTFHMLMVYKHTNSIFETKIETSDIARISTIGISDIDRKQEKTFFPLSYKTQQNYYFALSSDIVEKDGKLFQNIKKQMKDRISEKVNFAIYSTQYKENYCYFETHTHFIQGEAV